MNVPSRGAQVTSTAGAWRQVNDEMANVLVAQILYLANQAAPLLNRCPKWPQSEVVSWDFSGKASAGLEVDHFDTRFLAILIPRMPGRHFCLLQGYLG